MSHISLKNILHGHMVVTLLLIISSVFIFSNNQGIANASINDASGEVVGVTYYGGEYSGGHWIVENQNECDRIQNGEFTAASLGAILGSDCSDDNGLGWVNDIPLHNTVSYAELSNNPSALDGAALGGLPNGARLEIQYKGRCVVAEKRDNGDGGSPVNGYKRALDLWWQTAKAIGFTNGWDTMTVRRVSSSTPLSPLGGTSACGSSAAEVAPTSSTPSAKQKSTPKSIAKASTPATATTTPAAQTPASNAPANNNTKSGSGTATNISQGGVQQTSHLTADNVIAAQDLPHGLSYTFASHHDFDPVTLLYSLALPLTSGAIIWQVVIGKRLLSFKR